jgi:hypothetical protein
VRGSDGTTAREITADVIAASDQTYDGEDDEANNPQPTTASETAPARGTASVFNIATESTGSPIHAYSIRYVFIL